MKYQITFLKTTEKPSSKCHNSSKVERNFNRKLKSRYEFLCTLDHKEQVKINDFFHLIVKTRFPIKYISEDKKIHNSVTSNFFPTAKKPIRYC